MGVGGAFCSAAPARAFCLQRGPCSARGIAACRAPDFSLLCFASLSSCLSETWSLGPGSTVVAMATGASPPPRQVFGIHKQTGGKAATQESSPLEVAP